ncbi:multidrug effflux MFS transporter [Rubellimicrobium rubrum]|uniref:Multidrug effflux MFS transporter n=1 Tax=Rubellimicrobium rubrum TaxID=2585369 RepID=A0A5C4MSC4_9RHOB|nr:multidrug effflux MFS transporter [Rubellimicrobium rubrum]TNC47208.1 multidrug effflux MFS transporter [Rubellimicrobium rubrum]
MATHAAVRFLDRTTPPHIATLILASGIASLNVSVFLPSLARMADHFGASYAVMQLAVSGYLAMTAVLQIAMGSVADTLGRRPVMIGAMALFILATLGALFAPTAGVFLAFRMAQAVVITGIVLSRAVVRDTVGATEAASRIGYITMGMALIPMVGPMIGGALDESFGWQASFVLLAVGGTLVLMLVVADQGETAQARGDGLAAQLAHYPALLGSRRFWGYSLCAAFASGAFFALLGGASFVSGEIFGLSPVWTGIALGSPAIGYTLGNFLSGRFSVRVGIDRMAAWGCVVATLGLVASLVLTVSGPDNPWVFFGFCTALGLGNGMTLPNAMAGSISVRPDLAGTASGLSGAIMTAGGAALSVLAGAMLSRESGAWPLQALMAGSAALAGVSLLLVRGTQDG